MPQRNSGGRPPKYNEPSRPITVTLPESTLRQLSAIHEDRGLAIVKLAREASAGDEQLSLVEVIQVSSKSGLLILKHCPALEKIPFLHLVEVSLGRYLLAIDRGHDFRSLELALHDLLDSPEDMSEHEVQMLESLLEKIRRIRKADRMTSAEILLVDMETNRPPSKGKTGSMAI